MSATEIILIVIGVAVFLLGYLMPARKKDLDEEVQLISEDEVRKLIAGEVEHVKERISDIVDETVNYSIEKAERAMERVTNEKIMAINEYSDTVLEEINKNHKEVVFLYDMLNDKHDNLMSAINEATMAADDMKQTMKDAEITAGEAADKLDIVMQAIDDAEETAKDAENAAIQVQKAADKAMHTVIRAVENAKNDIVSLHSVTFYREEARIPEENAAAVSDVIVEDTVQENAPVTDEVQEAVWETNVAQDSDALVQNVNMPQEAVWDSNIVQEDVSVTDRPTAAAYDEEIYDGEEGIEDVEDASGGVYDETVPVRRFSGNIMHAASVKPEEPAEFKPISPRRVEIIHQPDGDYVADHAEDMSTSEAFASMGIFAPKAQTSEEPGRKPRTRRGSRRERMQENVSAVDIRFAQGKDNGRNSNERILELHKAGKSNMAIAKELGLGLGEVKLVIDLFEGM